MLRKSFVMCLAISAIVVCLFLCNLVLHYISVFKAFYLVNANVANTTIVKIRLNNNETEYDVVITLRIENPSDIPIFIEYLYFDSISGVYLNNKRLYYINYPRKGLYTEIPPHSSREFSLTIRIYDESSPDFQYFEKILKSGYLEWVFPLRGRIKVSFKSGIVDLTCRYNETYFLEDQS